MHYKQINFLNRFLNNLSLENQFVCTGFWLSSPISSDLGMQRQKWSSLVLFIVKSYSSVVGNRQDPLICVNKLHSFFPRFLFSSWYSAIYLFWIDSLSVVDMIWQNRSWMLPIDRALLSFKDPSTDLLDKTTEFSHMVSWYFFFLFTPFWIASRHLLYVQLKHTSHFINKSFWFLSG